MKKYFVCILVLILTMQGCQDSKEVIKPLESGGTISELFNYIPDSQYFAVFMINARTLLNHSMISSWLAQSGARELNSFRQLFEEALSDELVALAVEFDARAYPNLYKTFRFIALSRSGASQEQIAALLQEKGITTTTALLGETPVTSFVIQQISPTARLMLTIKNEHFYLSNDEALFTQTINPQSSSSSLSKNAEFQANCLFLNTDSHAWFIIRHVNGSQNLIQNLPDFDLFIGQTHFGKTINFESAMRFEKKESAQKTLERFNLSLKSMKSLKKMILSAHPEAQNDYELMLKILEKTQCSASKNWAVFKLILEPEDNP